jgi:hypothetical protein
LNSCRSGSEASDRCSVVKRPLGGRALSLGLACAAYQATRPCPSKPVAGLVAFDIALSWAKLASGARRSGQIEKAGLALEPHIFCSMSSGIPFRCRERLYGILQVETPCQDDPIGDSADKFQP